MPHNFKQFPYLVYGDGIVPERNLKRSLLRRDKHIPVVFYASTMAEALKMSDKMLPWNETVLICKVEKVVK